MVKRGYKVVIISAGGVKHDFMDGFSCESEARDYCCDNGWSWVDENRFEWNLDYEEDIFDPDGVEEILSEF